MNDIGSVTEDREVQAVLLRYGLTCGERTRVPGWYRGFWRAVTRRRVRTVFARDSLSAAKRREALFLRLGYQQFMRFVQTGVRNS